MSKNEIGLKLGDYEVLEDPNGGPLKLGEGAFGKTFLARQIYLDKRVALKVIHDHLVHDEGTRARFLEEARKQARLDHPNIAKIDYLGKARDGNDEIVYCAVEFCESGSLQDLMTRFGSVSPGNALLLVRQAARGLSHAHEKGLVHRDIKPSNLLISGNLNQLPNLKIIDFGIVKSLEEEDQSTDAAYRTKSWEFKGTPLFCSPEQARKETVDARSDIFSLGMTMWFLINDGSPLTGSSTQILDERCRSVGYEELFPHGLPASIHHLLARCLAVSPDDRFRDCNELEAAAQACIEELHIIWEAPAAKSVETDSGAGAHPSMSEHYSWQKEWKTATGDAYLGTEISTGRRVKVTQFDRFATGAGQFIKAAKLLEQIRHPNIVRYFSVREFREGWLVAREWVAGLDLMAFLQQTGPIKIKHASGVLRQIAAALDFCAENHPAGLHDHPSSVILEITGECDDHTPDALQSAVESGSVRAKMLPVLAEAAPLSTNAETQAPSAVHTIIETASNTSSGQVNAFSPTKSFCKLVYWVVGGRQVPSVRFEAVPGLEEGSNRIIRDVLSDKITGVKCAELCEQLLSIEGVGSSLAEWIDQIKDNITAGFSELQAIQGQMDEGEASLARLKQQVSGPDLLPPDHVQNAVTELGETIANCVRRASGFNGLADEAMTTAETYSATELVDQVTELRSTVGLIETKADALRLAAGELTGTFARATSRKVAERAAALATRARDIGKKVVPIRRRSEGKPTFTAANEARKATSELLDELYIAKDELTELNNHLALAERDLETRAGTSSVAGTPSAYQALAQAETALTQATTQVNAVRDLLATHLASHLNENTAAAASRGTRTLALVEELHDRALRVASSAVTARVKGDPDAAEQAQRELGGFASRLKEAEKSYADLNEILATGLSAAEAVPNLPEATATPLHKAENDARRAGELLDATRAALTKAGHDAESARTTGRLQRVAGDAERGIGKIDARLAEALREAQTILAELRKALKNRDETNLAMHREKSRLWCDQVSEIGTTVDSSVSDYDSARRECEGAGFSAGLSALKAVEGRKDSLRKRLTDLLALQKALSTQAAAEPGAERSGIPLWIKIAASVLLLGGIGAGAAVLWKDKGGKPKIADVEPIPDPPIPAPSTGTPPAASEYVTLEVRQRNFPLDAKLTIKPSGGGDPLVLSGESRSGALGFKAPRKALQAGADISVAAAGYKPLTGVTVPLSDKDRIPLDLTLTRLTANVQLAGPAGEALDARTSGFYSHFYTEIVFTWIEALPGEGSVPSAPDKTLALADVLASGAMLPTGKYEASLRRPRNAPALEGSIETGDYNRSVSLEPSWGNAEVTFAADDRRLGEVLAAASLSAGDATLDLPAPPPPVLLGFSSIEDNVTGGISIISAALVLRFPRIEVLSLAPGDDWSQAFSYEENIGATLQAGFTALQDTAKTIPQIPAGGDRKLIDDHLNQLSRALSTATSLRKTMPTSADQLHVLVQMLEAYYHAFAVGEIAVGGAEKAAPGMASAFYKDTLNTARARLAENKAALESNQWAPDAGSVLFAGHPLLNYFEASIEQKDKWYEGMDEGAIAQFGALNPIYLAETILLNGTDALRAAAAAPAHLGEVSMDFRRVLPATAEKERNEFAAPNQVEILLGKNGFFRQYPMFPEQLNSKGALRLALPYATQGQQTDSFSIVVQAFTLSQERGGWTLLREIPSASDSYSPLITPDAYFK